MYICLIKQHSLNMSLSTPALHTPVFEHEKT